MNSTLYIYVTFMYQLRIILAKWVAQPKRHAKNDNDK